MNKNKHLKDYKLQLEMQTRWRDLDAFGHVNNAVFASYIENARATLFDRWKLPYLGKGKSLIIASLTIDYYKQLNHPSKFIIGQKVSRIGNTSFDIESSLFKENKLIGTSRVVVVCFDFDIQKPIPVFKEIIEDSKL